MENGAEVGSGLFRENVSERHVTEDLWAECVTPHVKSSPLGLLRLSCLVFQAAETFDGEQGGNQAVSPAVPWATFPAGTTTS